MTDEQLQDLFKVMERNLDEGFRLTGERLDAKIDEVGVRIESVETALLAEIQQWSGVFDSRGRGTRDTVHALELEMMDLIKDRLRKLEGERPAQQ